MATCPKAIAVLFILILASCTPQVKSDLESTNDTTSSNEEPPNNKLPIKIDKVETKGDFNGDGNQESVGVVVVSEGEMQSKNWIYNVIFSNPNIPSFSFESPLDSYVVINEGPLNFSPGDELSIITQSRMMGLSSIYVYTFVKGAWGNAMDPIASKFLLPDSIQFDDLIFTKNDQIYFYEYFIEDLGGAEDDDDRETGFYEKAANVYEDIGPLAEIIPEDEIDLESDIDGDGMLEIAWTEVTEVASGEERETSYKIKFSKSSIPPIVVSSFRGFEFWSEGDLDGNPGSEISIATGMNMMNYNFISVYSLRDGKWKVVFDGLQTRDILPDGVTRGDLIFKENKIIYCYEDEVVEQLANKVDRAKIRTKIKLK